MGADDAAALGGNGGDRGLDLAIERVELAEIGRGIALILGLAGRIGGNKGVANIRHIDPGIADRLPGMRIGLAAAGLAGV